MNINILEIYIDFYLRISQLILTSLFLFAGGPAEIQKKIIKIDR